jgi:hypothetical protein
MASRIDVFFEKNQLGDIVTYHTNSILHHGWHPVSAIGKTRILFDEHRME